MKMQWYRPLDPECPAVLKRAEALDDDPIMEMSGCRDEFDSDFERKHRAECTRCQEYGAANIGVDCR